MPSRPISSNSALKSRTLFLAVTISCSVFVLIVICCFTFYLWGFILRRSKTSPFDSNPSLKLQKFLYKEMKNATNSFSDANVVGKGGSGTVYRGILRDGKSVAVKRLDCSSLQAEREFQNELQILGGLRSPHCIVTLLGFCIGKNDRILVYEFMPNRSLQELLFDDEKNLNLNWDRRFMIILDIARSLSFLHLDCEPPVIHGDVKPSNVLLDSDYRAKLSDFGLSRIKIEGEFGDVGVDMFSQELSGNLGVTATTTETPTVGTPVTDQSHNEVDFALALQTYTTKSSKINTSCYNNVNKASSFTSLNCNAVYNHDCDHVARSKGKEVSISIENAGEDPTMFVRYDDEFCSSVDHSKELNVDNGVGNETSQWGKDWWWRQDGSGELCSKDYVTEWIGTQIHPSETPEWDHGKLKSPKSTRVHSPIGSDKIEDMHAEPSRFMIKPRDAKHMKMQEWWKEEQHLDEISKKSCSAKRKLKCGFRVQLFHSCRHFHFKNLRKIAAKHKNKDDPDMEFSFRKDSKKKKKACAKNEMCSGDLFSRELSSTTSMRGTLCYIAPEYGGGSGCYLMEKSDIYSFGVLILVIVSGRRPLDVLASPMKLEKANLVSWCRSLAQSGNILELVDERLVENIGCYNKEQASLCINLALTCLQKIPELRPDTGEIVRILNGEMDLPPLRFEFSPSPPSKVFSRTRRKQKANA